MQDLKKGMTLQALMSTESTPSTDPNFNNATFEEKLNNGWLKKYFFGTIAGLVMYAFYSLYWLRMIFTYMGLTGYRLTWLGALIYTALCLFGAFVFFIQFQAIKMRSLEKQDLAIKFFRFFTIGALGAVVGTYFLFYWSSDAFSGIPIAVIAGAFAFFSGNVKRVMLGQAEESFKMDRNVLQA